MIRDDDVELLNSLECRCDRGIGRRYVGKVGLDCDRPRARPLDVGGHGIESIRKALDEADRGSALGGEALGSCSPETCAGRRDQDVLPLEPTRHGRPLQATPSSLKSRAIERIVDAYVEAHRNDLVEFAQELVAAPSPNPPGDERAVAAAVAARLRSLGVDDIRLLGPSSERRSVIARVPGSGNGSRLALSGHLDTKPAGDLDAWEADPWDPVVRDGVLYGLGSCDMKGAVAAMVFAAAAAREADLPGDLVLVLSADEETGGEHGARWLAEQGLIDADVCVIGEPSGIRHEWEAIRLVSRGVAIFTVRVRGTQMHSSLSQELPSVNANVSMARLMSRMADEGADLLTFQPHALVPGGPTLNVGLSVHGGLGAGVCPGDGEFLSDVRALPGMSREQIEADLERFLTRARAADPSLDAELEFQIWLPATEIAADHPVVAALAGAAEHVLGETPPLGYFPGGTDAPLYQLIADVPTVPSFGPGLLTRAHAPNESIPVESLVQAARIYAHAALQIDSASKGAGT